jgi:hypothetical protein
MFLAEHLALHLWLYHHLLVMMLLVIGFVLFVLVLVVLVLVVLAFYFVVLGSVVLIERIQFFLLSRFDKLLDLILNIFNLKFFSKYL